MARMALIGAALLLAGCGLHLNPNPPPIDYSWQPDPAATVLDTEWRLQQLEDWKAHQQSCELTQGC